MAKILIVEDSPAQILIIRRFLEKAGHTAIVAEDGQAGVDMAMAQKPDLVLMDVIMPHLTGFQATRKITKDPATCHIPVVILTTKDQETDKVWGLRQGARAYLTKPFNEAELANAINDALLNAPAKGVAALAR